MSDDLVEYIFNSMYQSEDFGSEFEKMNTINFLRLFFDTYDFYHFVDSHHITVKEYKKYFKFNVKKNQPQLHKKLKKLYKGEEK